ncbi:uncharacterized protein EI97DRAFT_455147 [Westerdykella ornata]|uniref:Uncharacterized protein n=1 Tax=Westerdykella ornata TaxID=318751 RepID=A0A6A6JV27_WESOR|nr:uncharacterized protein EI97DRAFT_455147 [Westerdykella ornata]KAF2280237.1 hypothetical protein EI97DRAFT_455147 [Westerdykella ornata]
MRSRAHKNLMAARRARQQSAGAPGATSKKSKANDTSNPPIASSGLPSSTDKFSVETTSTASGASTPAPVDLLTLTVYERKALGSVQFLLKCLRNATKRNHIHPPRIHGDLESAIHLCDAADTLGLLHYVQNTISYHNNAIFRSIPSEAVVSMVEELATSDASNVARDKFVSMVAQRIAYLVRKNMLTAEWPLDDTKDGSEKYLDMVSQYPTVKTAVDQINAPWTASQHARQTAEARRVERARRAAAAAERKKQAVIERLEWKKAAEEQYGSDMDARAVFVEKLKRQNKVMTLTSEEMELAAGLMGYGDVEIGRYL